MAPMGWPKMCEKCGKEIPGTDSFWDFRYTPYCDECESLLSGEDLKRHQEKKEQYCNLLSDIIEVGTGQSVSPDNAGETASQLFLEKVVGRKRR